MSSISTLIINILVLQIYRAVRRTSIYKAFINYDFQGGIRRMMQKSYALYCNTKNKDLTQLIYMHMCAFMVRQMYV